MHEKKGSVITRFSVNKALVFIENSMLGLEFISRGGAKQIFKFKRKNNRYLACN